MAMQRPFVVYDTAIIMALPLTASLISLHAPQTRQDA
jgi:hypothetical protein